MCVCVRAADVVLIFPQWRPGAVRGSDEHKDAAPKNITKCSCRPIRAWAQPPSARRGLLCRWRRRHIPLKWASLGWKPCASSSADPRPRLYLSRGGGAWSQAARLPARIPGSRVGVAREAHRSAPRLFCFGGRETLRWAGTVTAVTFHLGSLRGGPMQALLGAPHLGTYISNLETFAVLKDAEIASSFTNNCSLCQRTPNYHSQLSETVCWNAVCWYLTEDPFHQGSSRACLLRSGPKL